MEKRIARRTPMTNTFAHSSGSPMAGMAVRQGMCGIVFNILLMLALLSPATAATAATDHQPRVRAAEALVVIPTGWTRADQADGTTIFTPANLRPGEVVQIRLSTPEPARENLRAHLEADLKIGREKLSRFKEETEASTVKHPAGYDVLQQVVSFNPNPLIALSPTLTYLVVTHIDGGPEVPSQPVALMANNSELLAAQRATFDQFVTDLRLPSRMELAPAVGGTGPLTLRTANQVTDFLEWLLEVPLTESQRAAVQNHLVNAWKAGNKGEMDGVKEVLETRTTLAKLTPAQRGAAREMARAEAAKHWRQEATAGDKMAAMMIEVYDAARQPIAQGSAGEPPLTRQSADAVLEVLYFMASKAADPSGPDVHPTRAQLDEWATTLAANYANQPRPAKDDLAGMAGTWAALRIGWAEMSAEDRAKAAAAWAQLPPVKPLLEQIKLSQADQAKSAKAKETADAIRQVNLYQQLHSYGALQKNYQILFR